MTSLTPFRPRRTRPLRVGSAAAHRPERLRLRRAEAQADDLAPALGVDRDGDYRRDGDDPAALADPEVRRIEPQVGPFALEWPVEEAADPLVGLFAELGNLALADASEAHRLHQLVHPSGRDAADPSLLDDGDEGLLGHPPRLEERREVGALPELGDTELRRTEAGVERPLPVAVAPVQALRGALVAPRADQALGVSLHEHLQHGLRHRPQEVALTALLEQLDECHPALGHRVLRSGEARNSTLAGRPDDHLSRSPNFHHDRGRYPIL
jgi:hypothetical protein